MSALLKNKAGNYLEQIPNSLIRYQGDEDTDIIKKKIFYNLLYFIERD